MKTAKYSISERDLKAIMDFEKYDLIGSALRHVRDEWNFNVGDVLIKRFKDSSGALSIETTSSSNNIPKKYRVVAIDTLGVPWVKQINMRGGLSKNLISLVHMFYNGKYEFSMDPEQQDAILLDYEYDPRLQYKLLRKEREREDAANKAKQAESSDGRRNKHR